MKVLKKLIIAYFILVISKIVISLLVKSPLGFADSYAYIATAKSIFLDQTFFYDGSSILLYPPIYSLSISLSYIMKDMVAVFTTMKIINSFLLSLVIFPIYLLAKEFLGPKRAFIVALIGSLSPPLFSFSNYILSENLFFPLILFTIYFLYKSFSEDSIKWDILTGIFLGLSYLTKMNTIILFPTIFFGIIYIIYKNKDYNQIKRKIILLGISLIVVSPWLIRNLLAFGFSLKGLLGLYIMEVPGQTTTFNYFSRAYWTLLYASYAILSGGILFSILNIKLLFQKKLKKKLHIFIIILSLVILFSIILGGIHSGAYFNWEDSRPIGRYQAQIIPLIFILGAIGIKEGLHKTINYKQIVPTIIVFILSIPLMKFVLFPLNNMSLSYIGVMQELLQNIFGMSYPILALLLIISPFSLLIFKKLQTRKIYAFFLIFISLITLLNTAIIVYDSNYRWYPKEVSEMGRWINDNIEPSALIIFDERDHISSPKREFNREDLEGEDASTYMLSWVKNPILIGNVNTKGDYFISSHELNKIIVKKSETRNNKIYVYKL
jgi:4-amino-4-deoxy-L-arabinose transferase-like glycosyltransferase